MAIVIALLALLTIVGVAIGVPMLVGLAFGWPLLALGGFAAIAAILLVSGMGMPRHSCAWWR